MNSPFGAFIMYRPSEIKIDTNPTTALVIPKAPDMMYACGIGIFAVTSAPTCNPAETSDSTSPVDNYLSSKKTIAVWAADIPKPAIPKLFPKSCMTFVSASSATQVAADINIPFAFTPTPKPVSIPLTT